VGNEPAEENGDGAIELEYRLEHSVWKYSEVKVRVNYLERMISSIIIETTELIQ
jgi:hypothetical protein